MNRRMTLHTFRRIKKMRFDFETIMDRRGHDAIAVDLPSAESGQFAAVHRKEGFDVIPMWVADMNFAVVPSIQKAMTDRIAHPAFGYFAVRDEYYQAIIDWQTGRNGVQGLEPKHIGYENGVLGGVLSALAALSCPGDNILVHSPTYIGFTFSMESAGYHIVHSPLYLDENNIWRMDYEDMEKKIRENHIHTAIMCNPHNPSGRVWTKEELAKAMEIYERNQVYVISDEIWSDILLNGNRHTPTQSVNDYAREHTAAFYAPSKTFNLAGLIGSYHIIYNDWLRDRILKQSSLSHYNSMNVLSMHALIGAYSEDGRQWVDELKEVLSGNINYAVDFIRENLPGVTLAKPEGTYMLFLDCTEYCRTHNCSVEDVLYKGWEYGVYWQDGRPFHGEYSIRMNLALPLSRVKEAFERIREYVLL